MEHRPLGAAHASTVVARARRAALASSFILHGGTAAHAIQPDRRGGIPHAADPASERTMLSGPHAYMYAHRACIHDSAIVPYAPVKGVRARCVRAESGSLVLWLPTGDNVFNSYYLRVPVLYTSPCTTLGWPKVVSY